MTVAISREHAATLINDIRRIMAEVREMEDSEGALDAIELALNETGIPLMTAEFNDDDSIDEGDAFTYIGPRVVIA